ncbi:MAG: DUF1844 domain-containing protein [Syntrophobacteraceae bacterium]|jgi:hypothetical protein|nr:DUF1844 domain-containing protein [Syntrophobacteraceae bacterium]
MDEKEDKGFVVKDRRRFSLEDTETGSDSGTDARQPAVEEQAEAEAEMKDASRLAGQEGQRDLPAVSFATFVFSLSSSALVYLGEMPEIESQVSHVDLPLAKQIIDTLGMLEEKTRGNLDPDEARLLKNLLYDLRLRYVQKSGG